MKRIRFIRNQQPIIALFSFGYLMVGLFVALPMSCAAFFILLGLLLHAAHPNRKARLILADIILFAGATEIIQLYIDGWEALWSDVFIDCCGGFLGVTSGMKRLKTERI